MAELSRIAGGQCSYFCFQAEDGIRYLVRSRGLGDVYKRQALAVLGRNGVGKTSLLRTIAGQARLHSGRLVFELSLIHI